MSDVVDPDKPCSEENGWCGWCGRCREHFDHERDTQDDAPEQDVDEPKIYYWRP